MIQNNYFVPFVIFFVLFVLACVFSSYVFYKNLEAQRLNNGLEIQLGLQQKSKVEVWYDAERNVYIYYGQGWGTIIPESAIVDNWIALLEMQGVLDKPPK